jgi:predicted Zn-dependent protease
MLGVAAGATFLAAGCAISQQQELAMGSQYASEINNELPIVNDAAANQYINALGNRLASHGSRGIRYQFYIVNSEVVNAFAVPGGYIYVNRGLIQRASSTSELAGVLAHEIGHVEERHSVEQLERAQQANVGLTLAYVLLGRNPGGAEQTAINVGGGLYFARFSREAENEADADAVPLMVASGLHPNGLVSFFQKMMADQARQPSAVENWFSTHPTTQERIDVAKALVARVPSSQLRGLQTTTSDFQTFKSRLARYPAPPAQYRSR